MSSHLFIPSISDLHDQGSYALIESISKADAAGTLCPTLPELFKAFKAYPIEHTKVVILGQDPYHTRGKANGLAFGYKKSYKGPLNSSLENIINEVKRDTGQSIDDLSLQTLSRQGVLLLNTRLSTEVGKPLSHKGLGWETLIGHFLERLGDSIGPHVYMLWGREAQGYRKYINGKYNLILETSQPCAFSAHRGFRGCSHFSKANEFLDKQGLGVIQWGE